MLGKIYYKSDWYLMRFRNGNLEILHEKCVNPPLKMKGKEEKLQNERILCAVLENYKIYYFDIASGEMDSLKNEHILLKIKSINYFEYDDIGRNVCENVISFNKVSFINGVLKPMIEASNIKPFEVVMNGIGVKVQFVVEEHENEQLIELNEYSKLIPSNRNIEYEYKIELSFQQTIGIDLLNDIIKSVNKFIGFYNFDYYPYIQKIRVETNTDKFYYFTLQVNYKEKYIKRWNYVQNCPEDILKRMMVEISNEEKYDIGFLKLLNIDNLITDDIWCLSKSIDKMGKEYDLNLDDELSKEIQLYKKLRENIKQSIAQFEKDNSKIDNDKKSFILSMIEMASFRQKIGYFLQEYNQFAENYEKYRKLTTTEIQTISKKLQDLRNTIHGKESSIDEEDIDSIRLIVFALYYHILKSFGVKTGNAFNLLQHIFMCF
ncbi:MAG: hypothetical protein IJX51_02095 [Clostridia bacterium]|nr:hypothetical protein [Clostridia bacterium]